MHAGQQIRTLRKIRGWTILHLSTKAGVDNGFLSRLERGLAEYSSDTLQKLADALGVTAAEIFQSDSNVTNVSIGARKIPILSYSQAAAWAKGTADVKTSEVSAHILTDLEPSKDSFALRILGDSMLPEFREGDLVVIDPAVTPSPGDYVAACPVVGEAMFRRFRSLGSNEAGAEAWELVPLNDVYPVLRSDRTDVKVTGTMVEHRRYRRR